MYVNGVMMTDSERWLKYVKLVDRALDSGLSPGEVNRMLGISKSTQSRRLRRVSVVSSQALLLAESKLGRLGRNKGE